jgi:hypothetical protein
MIGKFYPLTPEMSNKMRKAKLTKHEMTLWLYLVEKDPFGDHYWQLPPTLEIIAELEMSKASYFRARARLQELELFDFQEQRVDCRNLTGVSKMRQESQKCDSKSQKCDSKSQKCDSKSQKCDSKSQKCDSKSQKRDSESPEPLPDNDSSPSQTIQTNSNLNKPLSEDERERFSNFCLSKINSLEATGFVVHSHDGWIAKHYDQYWDEFCNQKVQNIDPTNSQTHCGAASSTKLPDFESWIATAHEGQYNTLMNLGSAKFCENAVSKAWYEWARAKHPERFIEVEVPK